MSVEDLAKHLSHLHDLNLRRLHQAIGLLSKVYDHCPRPLQDEIEETLRSWGCDPKQDAIDMEAADRAMDRRGGGA